ncbi:relaxase/mobilization nuclease domain-containing protein [Carboxylicivirga sediminis]|uniref:Relaxase/mobilization nuclease domain-containing protein n=1 Tax=Carboxylicivirga sediminis TaxID=2006564 RepID=A0A941F5B5_9BACT|nr:relaxase/mobilization nuclease domain-containing protein [Carboxylicivirga sediminis]MBR8536657.1 relaxase/mobilization nuclease domain-containing protein [Carboxylicivirga sediminis]
MLAVIGYEAFLVLPRFTTTFMQHMGYGHHPYFVYEHADLKRTHFHIVSTRIDVKTSKKIKDNNEKRKVHQFIQGLQQRYELDTTKTKLDKIQLIPTINSPNLHEGVQQVFKLLNQSNIENRQEYLDILKAFNLELYQSEHSQSVIVKGLDGQVLRHPIALSQFMEPPNLDTFQMPKPNEELQRVLKYKVENLLKELNRNYRFYTIHDLREAFVANNLLPYQLSKNGNLSIYSPLDKIVVYAQLLLKRYRMRLQTFVLSNDQFHGMIREFTNQLVQKHPNSAEALLDNEKSILGDSESRNLVLKELNLDNCEAYNHLASQLELSEQEAVRKAIKSHLAFLVNKAIEKAQSTFVSYVNKPESSQWERLNHQFMIELLNYRDWENRRDKTQRKGLKRAWQKKGLRKS